MKWRDPTIDDSRLDRIEMKGHDRDWIWAVVGIPIVIFTVMAIFGGWF